jgi:RimJ/RimL family protein N-acetyltransferase
LGILIGEQKYKKIGVAKQTITISIKWLKENLGLENILLGVDNGNIPALKLYQKLGFRPIANKGKNGLLMNLNINELKSNDS